MKFAAFLIFALALCSAPAYAQRRLPAPPQGLQPTTVTVRSTVQHGDGTKSSTTEAIAVDEEGNGVRMRADGSSEFRSATEAPAAANVAQPTISGKAYESTLTESRNLGTKVFSKVLTTGTLKVYTFPPMEGMSDKPSKLSVERWVDNKGRLVHEVTVTGWVNETETKDYTYTNP